MSDKILIIRLSSFGDVAMLVPVVYSVAHAYPDSQFVVFTRPAYAPLFESLADNVEILIFKDEETTGFFDLLKLRQRLYKMGFTYIADMHDVLRSKIIRCPLFSPGHIRVAHIDKGRAEKKLLIETKKVEPPLTSTVERYRDVFLSLGFDFEMSFKSLFESQDVDYSLLDGWKPVPGEKRIGVAPYARHQGKIYPIHKMEEVVRKLSSDPYNQIFLFGGKGKEEEVLRSWAKKYPRVVCPIGEMNLRLELFLIHTLDVLVSMDSANMHLASLVGTTVVSVWGASHPSLGFYAFGQRKENAVQIDLACRPCSVYGNVPCARKDYACLDWIEPEMIVHRIETVIKK